MPQEGGLSDFLTVAQTLLLYSDLRAGGGAPEYRVVPQKVRRPRHHSCARSLTPSLPPCLPPCLPTAVRVAAYAHSTPTILCTR